MPRANIKKNVVKTAQQEWPAIEPLIALLNYFHPQEEKVIAYFRKNVTPVCFKSGSILYNAGTVCKHIYFIKKGVIRGVMREGKKEITTWISADNELVTSISSLDLELPSFETIQAIEDCDLLAISNIAMNELYEQFPVFNTTGRKLLQQYYRDAEKRAFIARLSNAATKYHFFIEHYGHLANRIQLRYIASYLGISIETLSRVRKKMASRQIG